MQQTKSSAQNWPVRPLTRLRRDGSPYRREPAVEEQIRELCALPDRARRERLALTDRAQSGYVSEETLVYFLREYRAHGSDDFGWEIADLLAQRAAGHVRRELACWRLGAEESEECARDLFTALWEALLDTGPAAEFWEVRFWVCLDRRLWGLAEKRQAAADAQISFSDYGDDGEEPAEDPMARVADEAPGPEQLMEYSEALALLPENERMALYLRYVEGWPEESDDPDRPSIARSLGVTGRSVRNYLRRAEARLRQWQAEGAEPG